MNNQKFKVGDRIEHTNSRRIGTVRNLRLRQDGSIEIEVDADRDSEWPRSSGNVWWSSIHVKPLTAATVESKILQLEWEIPKQDDLVSRTALRERHAKLSQEFDELTTMIPLSAPETGALVRGQGDQGPRNYEVYRVGSDEWKAWTEDFGRKQLVYTACSWGDLRCFFSFLKNIEYMEF